MELWMYVAIAGAAIISLAYMLPSEQPEQPCPAEDAEPFDGLDAEDRGFIKAWTRN